MTAIDSSNRESASSIGIAETGELVIAVALADPEIEPPAGQQVEGRGLLGQQHRVVPRQDQHGGAEAQGRGAGAEPGQQVEAGRNLAEAGEMVLDDKGRVEAERLGLDIVLDPLAKALAAVGQFRAGLRALRLGAAEQSEPHGSPHFSVAGGKVRGRQRYAKYRLFIAAIALRHRSRGCDAAEALTHRLCAVPLPDGEVIRPRRAGGGRRRSRCRPGHGWRRSGSRSRNRRSCPC